MTIDELKKKSREELIQLRKDGKIGWNEFLLSADKEWAGRYKEWLTDSEFLKLFNEQPSEHSAKSFLIKNPDQDDLLAEFLDEGVIDLNEYYLDSFSESECYLDWLCGEKPSLAAAQQYKKDLEAGCWLESGWKAG